MRPDAVVHAVELDPDALDWARHNVASHGGRVVLHAGDVRAPDLLPELAGRVDLVVCNPPYVPDATPVPPEVRTCDPAVPSRSSTTTRTPTPSPPCCGLVPSSTASRSTPTSTAAPASPPPTAGSRHSRRVRSLD